MSEGKSQGFEIFFLGKEDFRESLLDLEESVGIIGDPFMIPFKL